MIPSVFFRLAVDVFVVREQLTCVIFEERIMKMKTFAMIAGGALLSLGVVGTVAADEALATAKGCMACHNPAASPAAQLGPLYADVAAKYKGDAAAEDMLVDKVVKGGDGNWETAMPMMPPNAVTPEEARTLVKWIMTQ
jgi:cytochrome c